MSQLIACQDAHGIVLATDSKAIDFDLSGKMVYLEVDRLVPLSQHTAILAGGAPEGVQMCHALRSFIAEEGFKTFKTSTEPPCHSWLLSLRDSCASDTRSFPSTPFTTSTLSWRVARRRIRSGRFDFTYSGPRRDSPN